MRKGRVNRAPNGDKVKVIMGTNANEGCLFVLFASIIVKGSGIPLTASGVDAILEHVVEYHSEWNDTTKAQIKSAYPIDSFSSEAERFAEVLTDVIFACGSRRSARALAEHGHDVYLYHNEYKFSGFLDPKSTTCSLTQELGCGVYHGSDIRFVWKNYLGPSLLFPTDHKVSDVWSKAWTNFAITGNPNVDASGGASSPTWPKYNRTSDMHFVIDHPPRQGTYLKGPTCDFWDKLDQVTSQEKVDAVGCQPNLCKTCVPDNTTKHGSCCDTADSCVFDSVFQNYILPSPYHWIC